MLYELKKSYRRFLVTTDQSGGDCCGLTVDQLGNNLKPIGEFHTENQFWQLVVAVEASPTFLCGFDELEDMASAVRFDRQPFERIVR